MRMSDERKTILEKTKNTFINELNWNTSCGNRRENLVKIYNALIETFASSSSKSPLDSVRHYRFGCWKRIADEDDRDSGVGDILEILRTELNLYRALRLTCLLLLSMTGQSNNSELNDTTIRVKFESTVQQCQILIKILKRNIDDVCENNNSIRNCDEDSDTFWGVCLLKLTTSGDHEEEGVLTVSKEELVEEEQELCRMAEIPIPQPSQSFPSTERATLKEVVAPVGMLSSTIPSLSHLSLPIPVELDGKGVFRLCNGHIDQWWTLTSKSDIEIGSKNDTSIVVTHVIYSVASRKKEFYSISLKVGPCSRALIDQVNKIKFYLAEVNREQEEVHKLWSVEDVAYLISQQ